MTDDCNPASEFQDVDRAALIQAISERTGVTHVDKATWACFWLADIHRLRRIVENLGRDPRKSNTIKHAISNGHAVTALWTYTGRRREPRPAADSTPQAAQRNENGRTPTPTSRGPVTPTKRRASLMTSSQIDGATDQSPVKKEDMNVREWRNLSVHDVGASILPRSQSQTHSEKLQCIKRDREMCVVTRASEPVAAVTIFPPSLGSTKGGSPETLTDFWDFLKLLWGYEAVKQWMSLASPADTKCQTCSNLVTMSSHVEQLWRRGRFALKPIKLSPDRKTLEARFFWLPKCKYSAEVPLTTAPVLPGSILEGPGHTKLFDCLTGHAIPSGTGAKGIITFRTSDPDTLPLPSIELLELQWLFNRIVALSGLVN
ncbi:uncharacterized protein DSM5745_02430 [Aspergillus mulundensis]|uniref:Uncharacterized protein n=1 Tax=Aspergillus mulundensis TaxID=1810919 RepID=A0A3D8SWH5_9EURO|nr:hypothetical protein DSM5745_02430 [Aspergillus mulundensis]RDW90655.1 hypothetical protein DSM5745_02430 [Aspergillus mulundensis]